MAGVINIWWKKKRRKEGRERGRRIQFFPLPFPDNVKAHFNQ
jgi:hypothetical protein